MHLLLTIIIVCSRRRRGRRRPHGSPARPLSTSQGAALQTQNKGHVKKNCLATRKNGRIKLVKAHVVLGTLNLKFACPTNRMTALPSTFHVDLEEDKRKIFHVDLYSPGGI